VNSNAPTSPLRRQLLLLPWLVLPAAFLGYRAGRAADATSRAIDLKIQSDGDFLAFTPEELTCPPRARVRLWFHHAGKRVMQEHNWVLVKPGTERAVEQAAVQAGESNRWLPRRNADILAATPMCNPGQTEMIEFVAPVAGDYPFICSFPGHAAEMRGVLHVRA
jgi:azurin